MNPNLNTWINLNQRHCDNLRPCHKNTPDASQARPPGEVDLSSPLAPPSLHLPTICLAKQKNKRNHRWTHRKRRVPIDNEIGKLIPDHHAIFASQKHHLQEVWSSGNQNREQSSPNCSTTKSRISHCLDESPHPLGSTHNWLFDDHQRSWG